MFEKICFEMSSNAAVEPPTCAVAGVPANANPAKILVIGFAGVTNSHHCGALGLLLEPVAAAGMVGLGFSNASSAIMPWGGKRAIFGTNPVAAVFGRKNAPPIVVDLSLTQVTRGQIMLNVKEGKPIPDGWGMDKDGKPTNDAQKILVGGSLYAVGGLKGTMLALAVELICCALTGAALSHEVASMHTNEGPPLRLGQSFIAIDPGALAGSEVYFERVETLVAAMLYALHIVGLGAWSNAEDALGMSIVQVIVIAAVCLVASVPDGA